MVTCCALLGAFLPDLSLYVLAGVSIFWMDIPPQQVFDVLYYSSSWQQVFAIDNSFVLWGVGLAIAIWRKATWAIALCGAALLHLALDFPVHTHDARMHFWPISDWRFISPYSYWDQSHGGHIIGTIEIVLVILLAGYLIWNFKDRWLRLAFAALALLQVAQFLIWRLVF